MAVNRKPVHLIKGKIGRDFIWEQIRRAKFFTIPQIVDTTCMHVSSVREYINALTKAGYVSKAPMPVRKFEPVMYYLTKDAPIAPRVRKDGTEVLAGRGQENMWRAMRILKEFTPRDIAATASVGGVEVSLKTAHSYCNKLCQAGYLHGKQGRFKFIPSMYTGPLPPMIQRNKNIYDPNLKKVVWPKKDN